jgi:hypothetical protein
MLPPVPSRQASDRTTEHLCDQGYDHNATSEGVSNVIVVRRGMRPDRLEALVGRYVDKGEAVVVQGRRARARKLLSGLAEARPPFMFFHQEQLWTLIYTCNPQHALAWSPPGN